MGSVARSRERTERQLAELESTYGSFPVNQRTVTLTAEQYARLRERSHGADAFVELSNDDGEVLHVRHEDRTELPGAPVRIDGSPERRIRRAVREAAGIRCLLAGLERVTIVGLRNAADETAGTLYSLVLVFAAQPASEPDTAEESVVWKPEARDPGRVGLRVG